MAYASRGRTRLYYDELGERGAPPLLMVRGLSRTARHWGSLPDLLAQDFRVLVFDNRGVGRSSVPLPPYSTSSMAEDARAVLDATGAGSAFVFGVSLGGMIAQQLALRHPARVRALALGCTRAGHRAPRVGLGALATLVGALRLPPEEAIARTAPLILSQQYLDEHPEVVQHWQQLVRREPLRRRGVIGQLLAAARHDATDGLASLRCRTLAITGDADRLIPAECSRDLVRRIPGATLAILPGAGHDFPTERPEETARALTQFFLNDG